jgi:hypothetical protein
MDVVDLKFVRKRLLDSHAYPPEFRLQVMEEVLHEILNYLIEKGEVNESK